ncbi:helix-turn-helix domain-containing protein [Kutzneria sp. CA-103260]|uniref:helix-turn-helix domain-containing protein n=1 Tax=Kutzneria sp. CA-103260 TaxID=2802641 RepID=UPI001BAC8256|nr:XRE family transcriptional regulator [Kutzneria sp. CA-103260]
MGSTAEFVTRVGGRIRARRKERGWSVQQLADASSVSRRMLTDIELGQANPSLTTVDRIAHALDADFAALALPDEPAVEGTLVWQDPDGSRAVLLGATTEQRAELWRWVLAPGGRYDAEPDRAGAQEIHHVISGRLTLELAAGRQVLAAGQSAVIASDQEYAYVNETAESVAFMRVVTGA